MRSGIRLGIKQLILRICGISVSRADAVQVDAKLRYVGLRDPFKGGLSGSGPNTCALGVGGALA